MKNKIRKKKGATTIIVMLIIMAISASTATLVFGGMGNKSKEAGNKVSNILEGEEVIPPAGGGEEVIIPEVPVEEELIIPASATNVDPALEGYVFSTSSKTITKYTGTNKDVVIPKSFLVNGTTYEVTQIATIAFKDAGLTSVVIPSNILTIGSNAFSGNVFTGKVILDSNLTTGANAFSASNIGNNLAITSNVTKIPDSTFINANITKLSVPNTVISLGNYSFKTNNITEVNLPSSVTTMGVGVFEGNLITEFITPEKLVNIPSNFMKNSGLRKLIITENVKTIGNSAFAGNPLDIQVILNANLTSAGGFAESSPFYGAAIGANLLITDNVTTIPAYLFMSSGITSFNLPNSVVSIGNYAFSTNKLTEAPISQYVTTWGTGVYHINNIQEFTVPSYMTTIPAYFLSSNKLKTLIIPSHVTTIGLQAFYQNIFIDGVTINSNLSGMSSTGTGLVGLSSSTIYSLKFGSNVTRIPGGMFTGTNFNGIILNIPSGIVDIGTKAFSAAKGLTSVVFDNAVGNVLIRSDSFVNCTATKIYLK